MMRDEIPHRLVEHRRRQKWTRGRGDRSSALVFDFLLLPMSYEALDRHEHASHRHEEERFRP